MAELKRRRRRSTGRDETGQRIVAPPDWGALAVFFLLITLGPLAFGAVDQIVQVGLLVLFAVGVALRPPVLSRPSPRTALLLGALAVVLLVKEFAPAGFFGVTAWRTLVTENFGLRLPWTHHPEPGRAVDALLAGGLAVLWLLWVRTLAHRRENRAWLAWALTAAVAVVAAISFMAKTPKDPAAIFGLRYTPGWLGFGPFPNRNHSGCFFAMGVIMASGTLIWELTRGHLAQAALAGLCAFASLAGVLATQSRGGVVAMAAGLVIYGGLCIAKFRNRRTVSLVVALGLVGLTVALVGQSTYFARFSAAGLKDSNQGRVEIWRETVKMWKDAPMLGHGVNVFASIFHLYAHLDLDNEAIIHPESSWLQWLTELGLLPVVLAAVVAGAWVSGRARVALASHRSFFLYAAGFATAGALFCHGAIDVPGHRWGTAGFALAALGLACPRPKVRGPEAELEAEEAPVRASRRVALAPLAVAFLWALPLLAEWPAWSPLTLQKRLAAMGQQESTLAALGEELRWFPLNSQLHHLAGLALLQAGGAEAEWQGHFELAGRLSPGYWQLAAQQARACGRRFPDAALHFWQLAIERSGWRQSEIFNQAFEETKQFPFAQPIWESYVNTRPEFALEYVLRVPRAEALPVYRRWWQERGSRRGVEVSPHEAQSFYTLAPAFSSPEDFAVFLQARPAFAAQDYLPCARVLHGFGDEVRAWQLLSTRLHDRALPAPTAGLTRGDLERRLAASPHSGDGAWTLAGLCLAEGDEPAAHQVILTFAERPDAPSYITVKAAYILKGQGKEKAAVEMMLRGAQDVDERAKKAGL